MPLAPHRSVAQISLFLAALTLELMRAPASALAVTQPGGTVVPVLSNAVTTCADRNVQMCLNESEGGAGLLDAQADALIAPETFQPTCRLTFTPIVKGGYNDAGFGWYNVTPDPQNPEKFLAPTQPELFGMLVLNTHQQTGAQLAGQGASLDLAEERAAGRYRGGQIGFFLASGPYTFNPETRALTGMINELFYTQHALNPGSAGADPFYQVLTWQSLKLPQAFYFGWEDQTASLLSDNDFDDLVFLVSGIQCSGSGQPCDTGLLGACALGTEQCQKGQNQCVQSATAQPEKCNAIDDDCNGTVDDGDLCEAGKVCDRGRCVPKCGTAEFRCSDGAVCTAKGVCVEKACADKECPAGQVCSGGTCVDGCSGVVCPTGELCRGGSCVDPCQGIRCDEGYSCVLGVCQTCSCTGCPAGQQCLDNRCVEQTCASITCGAATHCAAGACVDDCAQAHCPPGQECSAGHCMAVPGMQPGSAGDDEPDGPVVIDPTLGGAGKGGGGAQSGGTAAPGAELSSGTPSAGCGCDFNKSREIGWSCLGVLWFGAYARRKSRAGAHR